MPTTVESVTPVDVNLGIAFGAPTQLQDIIPANALILPAEAASPISLCRMTRQPVSENELPTDATPNLALPTIQQVSSPQEVVPHRSPKPDALEVYLQVQRSVILMQKYARGFMVRPAA
ncbi:unnamed protein product [Phytophthora fragariaefolia]|uniref:Unnamed protein product n=1 Tax=Phytophthora fragariaefolia TaxID=1490495 RepID=A0A9W6WZW1_9STRA|nr:unnamed protein product [Phytophthora fragariaefolia]